MTVKFEPPVISDDDIKWSCRLLGLLEHAFHGASGHDFRADVLKLTDTADVAACPGSGKTTLLVAKLAILARKWTQPTQGICVLSHTNVARHEIEQKLGACATGQALLNYPHCIGTIHAFVNEFLALPWLRSQGFPIKIIDSDIVANRRWWALSSNSRYYLEKISYKQSDLTAKRKDFTVGSVSIGRGKFLGEQAPTYIDMCKVCKATALEGYFSHSEMFMWARDFLETHPEMIPILRSRFPMVFIDESQDNDDEQASLLYDLFCKGDAPVRCQRFGDANQAIFNNTETDSPTTAAYLFPLNGIKRDLPNSHRFNQRIADMADPFGLVPYTLKGEGPKKPLASHALDAEHTIFLYKNKAGAEGVLSHFGELLLTTFNDQELKDGTFKMIGQVTKKRDDEKFPAFLGQYWPSYEHSCSKLEPKPSSFAEYVSIGIEQSRQTGLSFACVQKIADGVLELTRQSNKNLDLQKRTNRHRQIGELLENNPPVLKLYNELVQTVAIEKKYNEKLWTDGLRKTIESVVVHIIGAPIPADAIKFLEWPGAAIATGAGSGNTKPHPNFYKHIKGGREVSIQVGSIHSVKGETHTGTLIVETFFHDFNIASMKAWLLGNVKGAKKGKTGVKLLNSRLKLQYVAMTRPSHLLCIAMQRSDFEENGTLDVAQVALLEKQGWKVREL